MEPAIHWISDYRSIVRLVAPAGLSLGLISCAYVSPPPLVSRYSDTLDAGSTLPVSIGPDGRRSAELSVMIYNVEGLPWPARRGRGRKLDAIAAELAAMRTAGTAPDIVMLQEAFSQRAISVAVQSGYRNIVPGPARSAPAAISVAEVRPGYGGQRKIAKGERFGKRLHGGLYVLTDLPVAAVFSDPFSARACAGFDCIANKGTMIVRVRIPGAPTPIDLFGTHMNSRDAAGVGFERSDEGHRYQVEESAEFIARVRDPANPLIFGGDFNMRHAPGRMDYFTYRQPYEIVHHYCTVRVSDCDIRMSWDGDAPWLDTQDLQGFDNGSAITVRPIRVEARFDGGEQTGARLSDHDAYLVTYRLSWSD